MIFNSKGQIIDMALSERFALRPEKQIVLGSQKTFLQPNDILIYLPFEFDIQDANQSVLMDFMAVGEGIKNYSTDSKRSMVYIGLFDFDGVTQTIALPLENGVTVYQGLSLQVAAEIKPSGIIMSLEVEGVNYPDYIGPGVGCFCVIRRGKVIYNLPKDGYKQHLFAIKNDQQLLETNYASSLLDLGLAWEDLVFTNLLGSWSEVIKEQSQWLTIDEHPTQIILHRISSDITIMDLIQEKAILQSLERFKEQLTFCRDLDKPATTIGTLGRFSGVLGYSQAMIHIKSRLSKVAPTKATILLSGESGTGKTLIAREICKSSQRSDKPFIVVNCAAIPSTLIESELFGYDEGAFTGAKKKGKPGYFEMANGGTIFLDEIGEMPLQSQGRLLEVIQTGSFFAVGGTRKVSVDVRIIAATNQNLTELVAHGQFRNDLYYRLSVFPIHVPPLRDRMEDLPIIARRALPHICNRLGLEAKHLGEAALLQLLRHKWPGNVRELENTLEKACILADGYTIEPEHIETNVIEADHSLLEQSGLLKTQLENYEKAIILQTLQRYNRTEAALRLGIGRTTLFDKIKRYGLEVGGLDSKNDS